MTPPVVALLIVGAFILVVMVVAPLSVRGLKLVPDQFMVGGRSFGSLLLWLLMAGEIYTSFTFLGAAGWAYGKGAPAFYILCYGTCAYVLSYFLLPPIWRIAKERRLLTGADFFADRYNSKMLGVLVAVVGFVFLVPYVTLQLTGLEILLRIAGYGGVNASLAVSIAFILISALVFISGLRGTAWASVFKDAAVLGAVIFAGVVLPIRFFGSPANVISHVLAAKPHWLTLDQGLSSNGVVWFVSTVLLTALGFFMWPQSFAAIYSAKSEDTIRRNAIFLPLYQLMLLLVYFAGFTALLVLPGLKGPAQDQSFMLVVQRYYAPYVVGLIAGAGCLAALVPASGQVLAAASIVTKNVLGDWLNVATTDAARTLATRLLVLVVAILALGFWLVARTSLVGLLLIGYNGVTQFLPGVIFALTWPRATAAGVGIGIVAGVALVGALSFSNHATTLGLNAGFFALFFNFAVCVGVSLATPAREATLRALDSTQGRAVQS